MGPSATSGTICLTQSGFVSRDAPVVSPFRLTTVCRNWSPSALISVHVRTSGPPVEKAGKTCTTCGALIGVP